MVRRGQRGVKAFLDGFDAPEVADDDTGGWRWTPDSELLHPEAQRVRVNAQILGGIAGTVDPPAGSSQRALDVAALHFFERADPSRRLRRRHTDARHLVERQRVTGRMDHRAFDDVLEFAHVSRP